MRGIADWRLPIADWRFAEKIGVAGGPSKESNQDYQPNNRQSEIGNRK